MSMKKLNRSKDKPIEASIRDVYCDNFIEEIKKLSSILHNYNHVAIDTEFPGVVYSSSVNTREGYYRTIKSNVDKLKLIQVGMTISDEWGNHPPGIRTWQFNLKFDLNTDQFSPESIALLTNSGINFDLLQSRGISHEVFGEYMITSGLVLEEDIHWVSFHGIYDFAYFLRIVTNLPIPETETGFFELLKIYFNNYYDIRFMVRFNDNFRCSLQKLGQELNVARVGTMHQAGSDSLITSEIYFKLKKEYLPEESTRNDRNVLFGIGPGLEDCESASYTNSNYYNNNSFKVNGNSSNNTTTNNSNSNSNTNFGYDYSNFYQQQNLLNMQYSYIRSNPSYFNMNTNLNNMQNMGGGNIGVTNISNMSNNYFPYNYNGIPIGYTNQMSTSNLSEETKKKYNLKGLTED